ncbi:hypothetical protein SLEP1_g23909 [Rubroshorea leprosula]|uniref:Uncharacterized protein n=1 Tax=Rubroshorea leprosula TaxID=152421 RepID=A0AAV5JMM6_9ROSI|nr:hypothetical protein SLEP1_g23909 [Rubroshorea leprosula]
MGVGREGTGMVRCMIRCCNPALAHILPTWPRAGIRRDGFSTVGRGIKILKKTGAEGRRPAVGKKKNKGQQRRRKRRRRAVSTGSSGGHLVKA